MKFLKIILLLIFFSGTTYALTCPPAETVRQFIEIKKTKALNDKLNHDGISYQLYDSLKFSSSTVHLEPLLKTDFKITNQVFLNATTNQDGSTLVCSYLFFFYSTPYQFGLYQIDKSINLISSNINKNHSGFINPNTTWKSIKCEDLMEPDDDYYCKNKSWAMDTMHFVCSSYYKEIPLDNLLKECSFSLGASIKNQ